MPIKVFVREPDNRGEMCRRWLEAKQPTFVPEANTVLVPSGVTLMICQVAVVEPVGRVLKLEHYKAVVPVDMVFD